MDSLYYSLGIIVLALAGIGWILFSYAKCEYKEKGKPCTGDCVTCIHKHYMNMLGRENEFVKRGWE